MGDVERKESEDTEQETTLEKKQRAAITSSAARGETYQVSMCERDFEETTQTRHRNSTRRIPHTL